MKNNCSKLLVLAMSFLMCITLWTPQKTMALTINEDKVVLILSINDQDAFKTCVLKDNIIGTIEQIGIIKLSVPTSQVENRIAYYSSCDGVSSAYSDNTATLSLVPTDPGYSSDQWNLQRMGMEDAWDITTGDSDIIVAVIDTGVNADSALADFDIDSFVLGASFLTDAYGIGFEQEDDYLGQYSYDGGSHGTAVSSVIGAEINESKIAGIAPGVKIMPLKVFLDESYPGEDVYAYNSDIAAAIVWAADHGADIINMSLGGDGDAALRDAVNYAYEQGVIMVAASGNESNHFGAYFPYTVTHIAQSYPAAYINVLGVGSIDQNDVLSGFSNMGEHSPEFMLDLVAYGEDIVLPWNEYGDYVGLAGTSFSSPTVAGVIALMLSVNPDLTYKQARAILASTADDITGNLATLYYDNYTGFGKVNPLKALEMTQEFATKTDTNTSKETAVRIYSGQPYVDQLQIIEDVDYYVFTLYETTTLSVSVQGSGDEDVAVQMFRSDLALGDNWEDFFDVGTREYMYRTLNAGTYYVAVKDSNGCAHDSNVTITLTVTLPSNTTITASTIEGVLLNHGISNQDVTVSLKSAIAYTLSVTKDGNAYEYPSNNVFTEAGAYVITLDDVVHSPIVFDFQIKEDLIISGVADGNLYGQPKTITFSSGTATLNSVPFISGNTINTDGTYQLIVTDGSITRTINFTIDLTAPTTNIPEGSRYLDSVVISFSDGTATINGEKITNNTRQFASSDTEYTLVVTDLAGNVSTTHFAILQYINRGAPTVTTTSTSLTMTFEPSSVLWDSVEVWRSTDGGSTYSSFMIAHADDVVVINDLLPNTYYYFKYQTTVTIDGVTHKGNISSNYYLTKKTEVFLLDPVSNYKVTILTNFAAKLEWTAVSGAAGYEIWDQDSWGAKLVATTTALTYTVTGLTTSDSFNKYTYGVRYYKIINGVKIYSSFVNEYFAYKIPAPNNVTAVSNSLTTIDVSWDAMTGMTGYSIVYYDYLNGIEKTLTSTTNRITITGLSAYAPYRIKVAGTAKPSGYLVTGNYCENFYAMTNLPSPVLKGTITGVSSLSLSWNAITGATGYTVLVLDPDTGEYVYGTDLLTTSTSLTGLTMGKTYTFVVASFYFKLGIRYYSELSVPVSVTPSPIAVTGLKSTPLTIGGFSISWSPMEGAEGYEICQATTATGTCTSLGTTTSTSFEKTGLVFNTSYYYQVRAYLTYDGARVYGAYSARATFKTGVPVVTDPVTQSLNYTSVKFSWSAIAGVSGYEVYRSLGGAGPYALVGTTTSLNHTSTGLYVYQMYFFKVRAYKLVGTTKIYGAYSTPVMGGPIPSTPEITVTSIGTTTLKVTWPAITGSTGYILWYSTSNDPQENLTWLTTNSATISGLQPNTTYYFRVNSYVLVGVSKYFSHDSNIASAAPVPNTPTLSGSVLDYQSTKLSWSAISGASGYELLKYNSNTSTYELLSDTTNLNFTDSGLVSGSSNLYKVRSYVMVGEERVYSIQSSSISLIPVPSFVSGLSVQFPKYTQLSLSWSAVTGASGYEVSRSTSLTGTYASLGFVEGDTSYTSTSLAFNTTYYYKVRAYTTVDSVKVYGAWNGAISGKTALETVTGNTVAYTSYSSNLLSWSAINGATAYEIYRSIGTSTTYTLLVTVTGVSYSNTALLTNTKYNYKVRAYRLVGTTKVYGAFSTVVSATPLPWKPTLTLTSSGYDSLKVTWAAVGGASGYEVSYSTSELGTYTKLALLTTTSVTIPSLLTNTSYYVKVRTYRIVGTTKIYGEFSSITSDKPIPSTPVLSVSSTGYTSHKLSWLAISGASGYELSVLEPGATEYALLSDTTLLTINHESLLTGQSYSYKIQAYRIVSEIKVYSNASTIVSMSPVPSLPTNLQVLNLKYTELSLQWTAVNGASGYEVSKSTSLTGTYASLGFVEEATSFTNTSLLFNTTYYYKVRSYTLVDSVKVYGSWSSAISGKTTLETVNGHSVAYTSYNSNLLNWSAINGATGYEIYRSIGTSTTYALLTTTTKLTYLNTLLVTNTKYNYKLRAYRLIGTTKVYGPFSSIISATPLPWNPSITVSSSGYNSLKVTWAAVAGASGYEVSYSSSELGTYTKLALLTTTTASIPSLLTDTMYYVKVRAYRIVGTTKIYGTYSSIIIGKPIPSTPVMTLASAGYDSVKISWLAITGASGYELYTINPLTSEFELVIDTTSLTTTHTGLTSGQVRSYKIKSYRVVGDVKVYSLESSVSNVTPIPSSVLGFKLDMPSITSLNLSWLAVNGATGYEILKSSTSTGTYVLNKTVEGSNSATITGLTFNTTTYYKVRAYTTVDTVKVYGATSSYISGKTIPSTVVLSVSNTSYVSNTLSWPAIEGASGYEIYYSTGTSTYYSLLKTLTTTSFLHSPLTFNTQYNYKVRAYKLSGTTKIYGSYSSLVSLKTLPSAPSAIYNSTYDTISLTWASVIGASGYEVSIATSLTGPYTATLQTTISKAYTGLVTGTTYYIKLRSYRLVSTTKVYGLYSSVITVTPSLMTPTLNLSGLTMTSATLSWDAIDGATDYEVRIKSDVEGSEWITENVSELSQIFEDLDPLAHYTAEVKAIRKIGEISIYSETSSSITFSYSETS